MRLLALTPIAVSDDEVVRRQRRYDSISPSGIEVVARRPEGWLPDELATDADIRASDAALVAAYSREDPGAWDGFLPDCVLDPAVHAAPGFARPIYGIGRLTMHALAGSGLRWRSVARNEAIARELDLLAQRYGTVPVDTTAVLSLSVADIADHAVWDRALATAAAGMDCDAVLNGCSAVDVQESGGHPAVVDPTMTALRVLAEVRGVRGSAA